MLVGGGTWNNKSYLVNFVQDRSKKWIHRPRTLIPSEQFKSNRKKPRSEEPGSLNFYSMLDKMNLKAQGEDKRKSSRNKKKKKAGDLTRKANKNPLGHMEEGRIRRDWKRGRALAPRRGGKRKSPWADSRRIHKRKGTLWPKK